MGFPSEKEEVQTVYVVMDKAATYLRPDVENSVCFPVNYDVVECEKASRLRLNFIYILHKHRRAYSIIRFLLKADCALF